LPHGEGAEVKWQNQDFLECMTTNHLTNLRPDKLQLSCPRSAGTAM